VLGEMPARREDPIAIEDGPVFISREEAEWEVFRRRWQKLTGEAINLPYRE
jgi:branched-chain amino acid transport system permease protein